MLIQRLEDFRDVLYRCSATCEPDFRVNKWWLGAHPTSAQQSLSNIAWIHLSHLSHRLCKTPLRMVLPVREMTEEGQCGVKMLSQPLLAVLLATASAATSMVEALHFGAAQSLGLMTDWQVGWQLCLKLWDQLVQKLRLQLILLCHHLLQPLPSPSAAAFCSCLFASDFASAVDQQLEYCQLLSLSQLWLAGSEAPLLDAVQLQDSEVALALVLLQRSLVLPLLSSFVWLLAAACCGEL